MDDAWIQAFLKSERKEDNKISGYYHDNYIVKRNGNDLVIRVPHAEKKIHRMIPEEEVLIFLEKAGFPAPRLLYVDPDSQFVVHSYIEGKALNHIYKRNKRVPDWIPTESARLIKCLHRLDPAGLYPYSRGIANSPDSKGFFDCVLKQTKEIYSNYEPLLKNLYHELSFPEHPFERIEKERNRLLNRNFVVNHCDIHRGNFIFDENKKTLRLIDWETCQIGDPAYDLAVHLSKMRYDPDQELLFLNEYLKGNRLFDNFIELQKQVGIYRDLEIITLAVIDTFRYYQDLESPSFTHEEHLDYAARYFIKLKKAWSVWGMDGDALPLEKIMDIFAFFANRNH